MGLVKETREAIDKRLTIDEKDIIGEMVITRQRIIEGIKHNELCWCRCNEVVDS